MPETKFEEYVFSVIMVFVMVYCMTLYNAALRQGLSYSAFQYAIAAMWPEALGAFALQKFAAGGIAKRLASRIVDMRTALPLMKNIAVAGCTVFFMAPCMTLYVALLRHGPNSALPVLWLTSLALNLPFAFFAQIFYVGPFVRLIFGLLFKRSAFLKAS